MSIESCVLEKISVSQNEQTCIKIGRDTNSTIIIHNFRNVIDLQ